MTGDDILRLMREDFLAYAPRALKIRTKQGSIQPFLLNEAQRFIHERLEDQRQRTGKVRALILKGRQQGASTYIGGRFYWRTSGEFGKQAYILTHEQPATDNLFGMTKRFHENCPLELRPSTATDNAKELWFDRLDSRYKVATAGSRGAGRSGTAQFFHGSEVAHWPDAKSHMAGIGQVVPNEAGTEVVLETTANGVANLFHGMWQSAIRGEADDTLLNDFIPIFVPWFWQREYRRTPPAGFVLDDAEAKYAAAYGLDAEQMAWRRAKIATDFEGDEALFNQEYPASPEMAFMAGSDRALIQILDVVAARRRKAILPGGARVLGVDPAEYGKDKSALVLREGRRVLWVQRYSKLGTMQLAGIVANAIEEWDPDATVVDVTGVGTGVADRLIEQNIPHVYRVHPGEAAFEPQRFVNRRAEMWWLMNEWVKDLPCLLPADDVLQNDLTSVQYHYDSSRRVVLMSKEKMRELGLPSPDSADALALTFAVRVQPRKKPASRVADRLKSVAAPAGSAQAA